MLSKKIYIFFFAISFILIAIFINEGYDDEIMEMTTKKENLNFLEIK